MLRSVRIQAGEPTRFGSLKKYRIPRGPRPLSSGRYLEAEHGQTICRQVISGPDANQRL
jgi:hypothetical protein